jgi:hypothetical protein
MCDPVSAGLVLSVGGSFLESREAEKNAKRVQNAKNNAYEANMIRQRQYADETGAAFGENINKQGRENFDDQKEAEADRVEQAFNSIRTTPTADTGLVASTPKNVVIARERANAEAGAETDRDVGNLANLTGYQGAMFNQGLDRNEFARLFGNVRDKASRDANLLGLDMQAAANNAQKGPSLFPTLMKTAGQGMSMFGAGGGSFSNTVEGSLPASGIGPGAPVTSYGVFNKGQPVKLFGSQLKF